MPSFHSIKTNTVCLYIQIVKYVIQKMIQIPISRFKDRWNVDTYDEFPLKFRFVYLEL